MCRRTGFAGIPCAGEQAFVIVPSPLS
ncbi:hypothetical protein EMIT0196P_20182 [Pseudomonas chlororaphis]